MVGLLHHCSGEFPDNLGGLLGDKLESDLLAVLGRQDRNAIFVFTNKGVFELAHFILVTVYKHDVRWLQDLDIVLSVNEVSVGRE